MSVSYLDQPPEVQARLARLKARDVILSVDGMSKRFNSGKNNVKVGS